MKLISSKELGAKPEKIFKELPQTGGLVVTHGGQPQGILIPTNEPMLPTNQWPIPWSSWSNTLDFGEPVRFFRIKAK